MVLLGGAVRHGTTPIDAWFGHLGRELGRPLRRAFLYFTEPWLVAGVLLAVIARVRAPERREWFQRPRSLRGWRPCSMEQLSLHERT